jgi:hypothetical protein
MLTGIVLSACNISIVNSPLGCFIGQLLEVKRVLQLFWRRIRGLWTLGRIMRSYYLEYRLGLRPKEPVGFDWFVSMIGLLITGLLRLKTINIGGTFQRSTSLLILLI